MSRRRGERSVGIDYAINTWEVPSTEAVQKLDTKSSSREKDGMTVRCPSASNVCPLQLWEVYLAVGVLILQPHSGVIFAHVKALCEHNDPRYLCESVLKEHVCVGNVSDDSQLVNMHSFFTEYFHRKFQISFEKHALHAYISEVMDDPNCGTGGIPRVYLLSPHVQAFLLNSPFFEDQYDELLNAMRTYNLPVNDVLADGDQDIGRALDLEWDRVKLYDDPTLVLKKYGGWAVTKNGRHMTPKDQLVMRLTGCTLEQLLAGRDIPDSPRHDLAEAEAFAQEAQQRGGKHRSTVTKRSSAMKPAVAEEQNSDSSGLSSHPSDFDVDPEHPKVVPLGVTLCEMYLLLRGLLRGLHSGSADWRGCVVGERVAHGQRDGHILAAVVLVDLYMRDQIEVFHWTLSSGNIAVAYKVLRKRGISPMEHFLDEYVHDLDEVFRDMRLPLDIGEAPIWTCLEERGVIDNHRSSWQRAYGCGYTHVDVWDLARPDLLMDLKDGYVTAARVLYDKSFEDPFDEEANDMLMFCHMLQASFDLSLEAIDGMARVLRHFCPPFHKGELFPPVAMVHSSAVCMGLVDRAFRVARNKDTLLAQEAAEFNETVMERLEERFFLSTKVWEAFDADQSGELSREEFVDGMRRIDVYKDFRKERVPDDVLRMIVSDLAERLFHEVDVNQDGTLTPHELQVAFKRRRDEALKKQAQRQWVRRAAQSVAAQMGMGGLAKQRDSVRQEAEAVRKQARTEGIQKERRAQGEWQAEVEMPEPLDEDYDIDTSFTTNR